MAISKPDEIFSKINDLKDFEIDGEYNDMEMVLEEQCNEMKSDDNQLDMYIDNIKKKERNIMIKQIM